MPTVSKKIKINEKIEIGDPHSFFLIGGPCVIESEDHTFLMAENLKIICKNLDIPLVFKASFDKANRSSIKSYRGPGLDVGLKILQKIKSELGIPVLSDIHETHQAEPAAEVLDVIQIPAYLCRQTDLILAAASTNKPVNIKKGQFLAPQDMKNIAEKALSTGNDKLIFTERGTSFGYNNLVVDIRSIPIMKAMGFPVVIDGTHSVQKPGGEGTFSGGDAEFIPYITKAGLCAGADGLFLEVHNNPSQARSDSRNSLNLYDLKVLLESLIRLKNALEPIDSF